MSSRIPARDETGASAVEYGLIVFAIAGVIVAILFLLGGVVQETYSDSCSTDRRAPPGQRLL